MNAKQKYILNKIYICLIIFSLLSICYYRICYPEYLIYAKNKNKEIGNVVLSNKLEINCDVDPIEKNSYYIRKLTIKGLIWCEIKELPIKPNQMLIKEKNLFVYYLIRFQWYVILLMFIFDKKLREIPFDIIKWAKKQ